MSTACDQGKHGYESQRQAHVAAAKSGARNIRAYLCQCGSWHFTRSIPKVIKYSTPPKTHGPKPYAPSLGTLKRWLANQTKVLAACDRRVRKAEQRLAEDNALAAAAKQKSEQAHREELDAIRKMMERLQWK